MCNSYPIVMSELEKCRNCVDQKKLTDSQCHNLYGFVIDLTGTTGNEKKMSHKYRKAGMGWAICSNGEAPAAWELSVFITHS